MNDKICRLAVKGYRLISKDVEKGASPTGEKQTTFTMILLKQQQPVFDLCGENLNTKQRTSSLHSSVYCCMAVY